MSCRGGAGRFDPPGRPPPELAEHIPLAVNML
jgi:hypothetical protein